MDPIIDFHTHIYPEKIAEKATGAVGQFYDIPMDRTGTVAALLESGKKAGVSHFVVCSAATTAAQVESINRFIAAACAQAPESFVGFGTLHPDLPHPEEAIAQIQALGLRGVKLHPDFQKFDIDDPRMLPVYRLLEGRLPVLFHTGDYRYDYSHPRRLRRVLEHCPGLTAIAAHFGGWSISDEGEKYLLDTDCLIDTSSSLMFLPPERARALIREFGPERVLFGSDFPMWDHTGELARYHALELEEEENRLILHDNACRILHLDW